MIDRNHPAVEAAERAATRWMEDPEIKTGLDGTVYMLNAALPRFTADDLRNTPAGRALMAEGWDRGAADNERGWIHIYDGHVVDPNDPLGMCQTCGTPNPYREETPNE